MISNAVQKFIRLESAGGILLFTLLILALIIANSPLSHWYEALVNMPIQIRISDLDIHKPMILWVNDGLMAVFFMLLAMEIKREALEGELSKPSQLALPVIGAIGGILFPALIYLVFNYSDLTTRAGWPIPTTTDIAFALGVIAILGKRVPNSLKIFLVALSIVDDIMAIIIIALFYTAKLSHVSLILAGTGLILLVLLNIFGVKRLAPYVLVGIFIWTCVLKSGVHATLAGVAVGFTIPLRATDEQGHSPLRHLEHLLHPWVAYMILPLFVFLNAGLPLYNLSISEMFSAVPIGIAMGLFLGKSAGVFMVVFIVIKIGLANLPKGVNWLQLFGICAVTGIGFTMSLFLASLAFYGGHNEDLAKAGVLFGSLLSGVLAVNCLIFGARKNVQNRTGQAQKISSPS